MSLYAPGSEGLLAPLTQFLSDPQVSEILVNKPQEVWIEKEGALQSHPVEALTEAHLVRLFQLIANENKQRLSKETPLLSGSLLDGSRVQLCLPPTAKYPALSIRRKVVRHFTLENYSEQNFYQNVKKADIESKSLKDLSQEDQLLVELYQKRHWDSFIRWAITNKKNIVISGGTSSGKTTFLNACLHYIDHADRMILLEDTREIDIPHPNQVQLLASKGDQGEARVNMQDLVQCCLRLRPDRIIMGEIRGREIMDFISACSTGHEGSLTSIHANNPRIAFMRMTQMYKLNNVPSMTDQDIMRELKEVIDIIIQIAKTPEGRKVQGIYYKHGNVQ